MVVASPLPTPPPVAALVERASSNTCGWISADPNPSSVVSCSPGQICGVLSVGPEEEYLNCCTATSCTFWTTCVQTCTGDFCDNFNVLTCTGASSLCGSFVYQDVPMTGYYCTDDSLYTSLDILDYDVLSGTVYDTAALYLYTSSEGQSIFTAAVTVTSYATSVVTASPTGSGGANGTSGRTSGSSGSSTPVGAIAGGVVGGVVAIGLVVALVFWLLKRRRARAQPEPIMAAGPPPGGPVMSHNTQPVEAYRHMQQTPLATHHYAARTPDGGATFASGGQDFTGGYGGKSP